MCFDSTVPPMETDAKGRRGSADAAHIASAAFQSIDFLLTWNSTHIANAELRPIVEQACRNSGYAAPILCTPDELMGG